MVADYFTFRLKAYAYTRTLSSKRHCHILVCLRRNYQEQKKMKVTRYRNERQTLNQLSYDEYHSKMQKGPFSYGITCSHMPRLGTSRVHDERGHKIEKELQAIARCFTLFQVAISLSIAFSTSLEGSIVEMKPATPVAVDTAVSLKA